MAETTTTGDKTTSGDKTTATSGGKAASTAVTTAEPVDVDPHAAAWAERQKDPSRYENATIATPGILEDIDEDKSGPHALVDPDTRSDLDISVDNRDQVQPVLERFTETMEEDAEEPDVQANRETYRSGLEAAPKK